MCFHWNFYSFCLFITNNPLKVYSFCIIDKLSDKTDIIIVRASPYCYITFNFSIFIQIFIKGSDKE